MAHELQVPMGAPGTIQYALCVILMYVAAQAQLADSDGMVDADSSHEDFPLQCNCFNLLLRNMATFFAW